MAFPAEHGPELQKAQIGSALPSWQSPSLVPPPSGEVDTTPQKEAVSFSSARKHLSQSHPGDGPGP
jgi:hypothetical protein